MPVKTATRTRRKSLFARLGGKQAISTTVAKFYERVLDDPDLKPFFANTDIDWLRKRQVAFFTQALGGPSIYKGADMGTAHAHLRIEPRHFNRVVGYLVAALQDVGAAQGLIDEVVAAVGGHCQYRINRKYEPR